MADVFISYRRDGGALLAHHLEGYLAKHGFRTFRDVRDMHSGRFPPQLHREIAAATNFVLVLTKGSLERCTDPGDWLREEYAQAKRCDRNIVPLLAPDFSFADVASPLPGEMSDLPQFQSVTFDPVLDEQSLDRLRELLKEPDDDDAPSYSSGSHKWCAIAIALLSGLLAVSLAANAIQWDRAPAKALTYSFEDGKEGWEAQNYADTQGCVGVESTDSRALSGARSLAVQMDLIGEDRAKQNGEAWANWQHRPLAGFEAPLDLEGRRITAKIYAPAGAFGESGRPNGFQLFVKDEHWNSLYGPWRNVLENEWTEIAIQVDPQSAANLVVSNPDDSASKELDPRRTFDPRRILAIGIKMGIGEGSNAQFHGEVYLDDVRVEEKAD